MAGRSAFSYLASKISTTHFVALRVLVGSWAKQVFSLSALVILGLSCRLTMFLMGKRILCHKPPRYVPYKGTYVPYDGSFGAPDQGQMLDV